MYMYMRQTMKLATQRIGRQALPQIYTVFISYVRTNSCSDTSTFSHISFFNFLLDVLCIFARSGHCILQTFRGHSNRQFENGTIMLPKVSDSGWRFCFSGGLKRSILWITTTLEVFFFLSLFRCYVVKDKTKQNT